MSQIRVGQGVDLHRLIEGKPLKIAGVLVDSPIGSDGHSDGDAVLHAVIDALLGATGLGDIGDHFPPGDPRFKDIDSLILLEKTLAMVRENGWAPINIDVTVLLETPKLSPYKQPMREVLSNALGMDLSCISLKAKTAEGLGAIGSREAYGATVIVLVEQTRPQA